MDPEAGRTDRIHHHGDPAVDLSLIEELLIAGDWVPIKAGSIEGGRILRAFVGGSQLFFTFVRKDGKECAVLPEAIGGFSPLVAVQPEVHQSPTRPTQFPCAACGVNVVSRNRQHCATCCQPDCTCDLDGPFITVEEQHEAQFLAKDYEDAARRNVGRLEERKFLRMAQEQRARAALPVREPTPELDTGSPISDSLAELIAEA
jgi:hypothetical protein